ncbi:MAG: hypothetical protein AB7S99_23120, partial [Pseudodonghicola sp.]
MREDPVPAVPTWVPESARRYLHHTVAGRPIRDLARRAGCHASTVLRQIRRVEMRRDDPLVDAALAALARAHFPPATTSAHTSACISAAAAMPGPPAGRLADRVPDRLPDQEPAVMTPNPSTPSAAALEREARRVLSCLSEPGAVLAVAEQMEKAVVVRGETGGAGLRTAVVAAEIAQAMALKDWIACSAPGRISRYRITGAGRAALRRMLAEAENRARAETDSGFAEAQAPYGAPEEEAGGPARRLRYGRAESPLAL